jgi:hypothetical protein
MTEQKIFDTVALHLIKQGKQSIDAAKGMCLYRGPNGLKCAVGCLIPDKVYRPEMEGHSVSRFIDTYDGLNFLQPFDAILNDLQEAHDATYGENQKWTDAVVLRLRKIAKKYNLSTAALEI